MTHVTNPSMTRSSPDDPPPALHTAPDDADDVETETTTEASSTPGWRRRWRGLGWVAGLLVLIAVAAGAWWVGSSSQSPDQAAARATEPDASWVTAPVEFRVLSATLVTRGDVQPETSTNISTPASVEGDAVVTQNVVKFGDVLEEGDRVIEVSGRPVFVLQGDVAVYRTLQPGMDGDDVTGLQAALARLGYTLDPTGVFDEATKAAVTAFYSDAGYDTVPTSPTYGADLAAAKRAVTDAETAAQVARSELAAADTGPAGSAIAAADSAVAAAQNALEDAQATRTESVDAARLAVSVAEASRDEIQANPDVTVDEYNAANVAVNNAKIELANAIRDNDAAVEAAANQRYVAGLARGELDDTVDTTALQAAVASADTAVADANAALAELQRVNGPTVPHGEVVFVTSTPTRVLETADTGPSGGPDGAEPAAPAALVSLASGDLVVTATVRPDEVGLVNVGLEVELLDELTNTTYPATVADVASEATTDASGQLGHKITVTPQKALPDNLVGTNVRVTLTAASTDTEQLVVPVAAVTSSADGTTRVSVLDSTGTPIEIEVTAGLSADGFVAIEPVDPDALDTDSAVIVGR